VSTAATAPPWAAVILAVVLGFLPFHLGPGAFHALSVVSDPRSLHRLVALAGLLLALLALPLGLAALAYREGRLADPRWTRRHKALARPAALLLGLAALLGLLQAALRIAGS
jgi:Na+/proline symporter